MFVSYFRVKADPRNVCRYSSIRSGYADDYNRSVGGESTRLQQSGGLTSWGDIMDREDRFTERRTADR